MAEAIPRAADTASRTRTVSPSGQGNPIVPARFKLLGLLGRGGMAVVYRALDGERGYEVALKTLPLVSADDRYLLKREFRAIREIVHPNLVELYELFVEEQGCCFTMELVRGADLQSYVRRQLPGAVLADNEAAAITARLRDTAPQLAAAVQAVHASGKLHRDIKPSNVLVSESGRVVLLDLGLVGTLDPREASNDGTLVGTVQYMPPEQAFGGELSPASDWYGFGSTLYCALSGRLPFELPLGELLLAKRRRKPEPLHSLCPWAPEDVCRLIDGLLDPDPAKRPAWPEISAVFGGVEAAAVSSREPESGAHHFVGRVAELELLGEALRAARQGRLETVVVRGPSGIGKSELVRRFLQQAAGDCTILRGRCHPHESVAYNALDGAIDELSRVLSSRDGKGQEALWSEDADALRRLFPVLGRVPSFEHVEPDLTGDQGLIRLRAFSAFRELLERLSEEQPVVLWLDDLQWGDAESGALLRELLSGPARARRLLVVLSHRSDANPDSPCLQALAASTAGTRTLDVGALAADECAALLQEVAGASAAFATERLEEARTVLEGSPFLVGELARFAREAGVESRAVPAREALTRRLENLDAEALRALEVAAVAGGPLPQHILLRAADVRAGGGLLTRLERRSLLRPTRGESGPETEVYHHFIRDQLLASMPLERQRSHHRRIGDALAATSSFNPQLVLEHYERAEDLAAVRRYLIVAARHASGVLAFDRAVRLYRRAVEIGTDDLSTSELHVRLAAALANARRPIDAGDTYVTAASLLDESHSGARSHLLRCAATQYFHAGNIERGVEIVRGLLTEHGAPWPRTGAAALRTAMVYRLKYLLSKPRPRVAASVPEATRERLEVLFTAGSYLGISDYLRAGLFSARHLSEALAAGDRSNIVRALTREGVSYAIIPLAAFRKRAQRMFAHAHELVDPSNEFESGFLLLCEGASRWCDGDWEGALQLLRESQRVFLRGPDTRFYSTTINIWAFSALAFAGRLQELAAEQAEVERRAALRHEPAEIRSARLGEVCLVYLARDQAGLARELADGAMSDAHADDVIQHMMYFIARALVHAYEGDGWATWRYVLERWPKLEANHHLAVQCTRDELLRLHGRAALQALLAANGGSPAPAELQRWTLPRLKQQVEKDIKTLRSHRFAPATAWATALEAGLCGARGADERRLALLEQARREFAHAKLGLYEAVTDFALACAQRRAEEEASARAKLARLGVVDAQRFCRALLPGCS